MDRRTFILTVLSLPLINKLIPSPVRLASDKFNYKPHPSQLAFFEREGPEILWGLPYHESNASVGTWCGISRSSPETQEAILEMVKKLQEDKSVWQ